MEQCELILKNAVYLDSEMRPQAARNIVIRGGKIAAILPLDAPLPTAAETIEGSGLLWMPGLTDGHTHTSQQLLRGRLLDEKPVIWKRVNVPFESRLTEESSRLSAQLAAIEMIKSGTTGFVDAGGKYVDEFAAVYDASGLRGRLTFMTNDSPFAPDALRTSVSETLSRMERLRKSLTGRLSAYYSLTTLPVVSRELIHAVFEAAKESGTPVEVHMNEYASEVHDFMERYGMRPFEYLEAEGLLDGVTMIAPHCITLSESEMEIMAAHQVRAVHCPFSNCGKGIPPTPQLLGRGVPVALGSDGSAHGGADLFREIRLFRSLMQVHWGVSRADSAVMPAETLLSLATRGGAAALTMPNGGVIEAGAAADLIALDITQLHLYPTQNIVHTLVESATGRDVCHSIADGRVLMYHRELRTLDEEKIRAECVRLFRKEPFLQNWE